MRLQKIQMHHSTSKWYKNIHQTLLVHKITKSVLVPVLWMRKEPCRVLRSLVDLLRHMMFLAGKSLSRKIPAERSPRGVFISSSECCIHTGCLTTKSERQGLDMKMLSNKPDCCLCCSRTDCKFDIEFYGLEADRRREGTLAFQKTHSI